MRLFHFALFAALAMCSAPSLVASTFYVGSCRTGAFATIQAAVSSVPAGSTIDVCPGTYPEQVVISKKLTLQGIFSNNSSQAVITVPSAGLVRTGTSISLGRTVAAQVKVHAAGVNISGITVDGTASTSNCPPRPPYTVPYIGIFYSSGSSGTISEVETLNQNCNGYGVGIVAENGAGTAQSVTVANSDVNNSNYGIWACSDQTSSTLTASITGNYVAGHGEDGVITTCNGGGPNYVAGGVSSNNISGYHIGVYAASDASTVSGNTITNSAYYGIAAYAAGSLSSNHISNSSSAGITLFVAGARVKNNSITQTPIGIEFNCHAGTVSGNTINGAATGIDNVPAAVPGVNISYNVAKVRSNGACRGKSLHHRHQVSQ